ncbi:MAG: hypothetical protein ACJ749_00610 [Flavisolibacter sp.]
MVVLQIEHPVPDFFGWKKAFDSDPLNRKQCGVRSHRIFRPLQEANHVIIELDFDNYSEAEAMQAALQKLWNNVSGVIVMNPQSRILDTVETMDY